jgi:hypothetical protein
MPCPLAPTPKLYLILRPKIRDLRKSLALHLKIKDLKKDLRSKIDVILIAARYKESCQWGRDKEALLPS